MGEVQKLTTRRTFLDPRKIELDTRAQPRDHISQDICASYVDAMKAGDEFPPVAVFFDGSKYWCGDGFHRVYAARAAGITELEAEVHQGGIRDAILYACGANSAHGYRRTNEDKRRAVLIMLGDIEWKNWSDREIGEHCKVSHTLVQMMRPKPVVTGNVASEPPPSAPAEIKERFQQIVASGKHQQLHDQAGAVWRLLGSYRAVVDGAPGVECRGC